MAVAASCGNASAITILLEAGASVDLAVTYSQQTPLMLAAAAGHGAAVAALLAGGAIAKRVDINGLSALDLAESAVIDDALRVLQAAQSDADGQAVQ